MLALEGKTPGQGAAIVVHSASVPGEVKPVLDKLLRQEGGFQTVEEFQQALGVMASVGA